MRRARALIFFLALSLAGLLALQPREIEVWSTASFSPGEVIRYKVHYGLVTAADASLEVDEKLVQVNKRTCFRATLTGHTTGTFALFMRIHDTWRSCIDTSSQLPQQAYRNIEENKYRRQETVTFDHLRHTAAVERQGKNQHMTKRGTFSVPDQVQDILSGLYYLRTLDYSQRRPGEVIQVPGFFDEKVFTMDVTFQGRETVETKAGTMRALKLVPKLPDNKLFRGENAIAVYLSDDQNQVPVLIQAQLLVGAVKVDMYQYKCLKARLNVLTSD